MEILEIAQNSGLHDYAVEDVTVDYKAGQIKLHLLTPALNPCKFKFVNQQDLYPPESQCFQGF